MKKHVAWSWPGVRRRSVGVVAGAFAVGAGAFALFPAAAQAGAAGHQAAAAPSYSFTTLDDQADPAFNQLLGFPQQEKIGDYIGMVSLNEGACIAYSATFNGEEDIYFARAEFPITASIAEVGSVARISWNSTLGVSYCVQASPDLTLPWSTATNVGCLTATNGVSSVDDTLSGDMRYYRVVRQP